MNRQEFAAWAENNIILLDGALGSVLYTLGMPRGVSTELWVLDHEDILCSLQRAYADAGSQIIYAPTFSANRSALTRMGISGRTAEINRRAVELTKKNLAGREVLIAGDISPTGKSQFDISYEETLDIYREQVSALAEAGVDLIAAETMVNLEEPMAVVDAVNEICPEMPVFCSLTVSADGRGLFGSSAAEAVETLQAMGASAVGINCSVGPDQLSAVVSSMKAVAEVPVIAKPNAGMPFIDDEGKAVYPMDAVTFSGHMKELIGRGAGIVGGCCGTNPDYIRELAYLTGRATDH